jgi:hypothetical protein
MALVRAPPTKAHKAPCTTHGSHARLGTRRSAATTPTTPASAPVPATMPAAREPLKPLRPAPPIPTTAATPPAPVPVPVPSATAATKTAPPVAAKPVRDAWKPCRCAPSDSDGVSFSLLQASPGIAAGCPGHIVTDADAAATTAAAAGLCGIGVRIHADLFGGRGTQPRSARGHACCGQQCVAVTRGRADCQGTCTCTHTRTRTRTRAPVLGRVVVASTDHVAVSHPIRRGGRRWAAAAVAGMHQCP